MRIQITLFFILSSLTISSVFAKNTNCNLLIIGKIHDNQHQTITGVSVYIPELRKGVITDAEGKFIFSNICQGHYTLVCRAMGYQEKVIDIQVISNKIMLEFRLDDDAIHLEEVRVEAEKNRLEDYQTQAVQSLSEQDLFRGQGQSLSENLAQINGVTLLKTGTSISKPMIQGLSGNRITILNQGIQQEGQQWGQDHAPAIDPFSAQKITVIKGASAVEYGSDAVGGVILTEPNALPTSKMIRGNISNVLISNGKGGVFNAMTEGGFGNGLGWRLQSSFKKLGDVVAPNYVLSNTGMQEFNVSGALGWQTNNFEIESYFSRFQSDYGILAAAHIGNTTDLFEAIENQQPAVIEDFTYKIRQPRQQVRHDLVKVQSFYQIREVGKIVFRYGFQQNIRQEFDIRRANRSEKPASYLDLKTHSAELKFEYISHKKLHGKIGILSRFQDNFNNVLATGTRRFLPDYDLFSVGVFSIQRLILNQTELELGGRYDFKKMNAYVFDRQNNLSKPRHRFHNLASSMGLIHHFSDAFLVRSHLGFTSRNPNINELYSQGLHHGSASIEEGNSELQMENSWKWVGSFSFRNPKFSWIIEPYFQRFKNYIYLTPKEIALTIRGAFPVFRYVQTDVNYYGVDAQVRYWLTKNVNLESKISYLKVKDIKQAQKIAWIPPMQFSSALTYEKAEFLGLQSFNFSIQARYHARQNDAPHALENIRDTEEVSDTNFDFMDAPESYTLWNLELGSQFGKQKFRWNFEVENLFNLEYKSYMNRLRYFAHEIGRNITIRIMYQF